MDSASWGLVLCFVIGYALIALEAPLGVNKSAIALLMGVLCWGILFVNSLHRELVAALSAHVADIAAIVFFVLCAMTIVETIRAHQGFLYLARWLDRVPRQWLPLAVVLLTFALSAVIDNVTTTLVMVALLRGLMPEQQSLRTLLVGLIIIAANAGGAWSPIGDVTTTMLWIGGHIHAGPLVRALFLPALVSALLPVAVILPWVRSEAPALRPPFPAPEPHAGIVLAVGLGGLLAIPLIHTLTGLPPVFGAFGAVGLLWVVTELLHRRHRQHLEVQTALRGVDLSSLLFFVGILLAVDALETGHVLVKLAGVLDRLVPAKELALSFLGLVSAVVDNVPLTALAMKMYAATYPPDHWLWMLLAYAVGTGGSILVIGSAAGVVAMNAEGLEFFWYLKRIGPLALLGYGAGVGCFLLLKAL